MEVVDIIVIAIVAISALISVARGFVKEMLSLIAWVAAFFVTINFYRNLASLLTYFDEQIVRSALAIFILFFGTLILLGFVNLTINLILKKTGLSGTDRMLGMIFGAVRGIVIVLFLGSAFSLLLNSGFLNGIKNEPWLNDSVIFPEVIKASNWVLSYMGLL
jgi:membrane protein required for colicin V production